MGAGPRQGRGFPELQSAGELVEALLLGFEEHVDADGSGASCCPPRCVRTLLSSGRP
jgi:hypothetical protein